VGRSSREENIESSYEEDEHIYVQKQNFPLHSYICFLSQLFLFFLFSFLRIIIIIIIIIIVIIIVITIIIIIIIVDNSNRCIFFFKARTMAPTKWI
jgi:hypothetical protein